MWKPSVTWPVALHPLEGEGPAGRLVLLERPPGSRAGARISAKALDVGLPFRVAAAAQGCLPRLPLPDLSHF